MVGDSKILTVSYGTFSCTLEGFDDPFNTMKAIAEYFRDLAADDRYFGAEPPTPDAAMLHRIAEREVHRMVEVRVQDNSVILREQAAPANPPVAAVAAPAPAAAAPPAAPELEESVAPTLQPTIPGGVAAKLARIRQSVDGAPAEVDTPTPGADPAPRLPTEPDVATHSPAAASSPIGYLLSEPLPADAAASPYVPTPILAPRTPDPAPPHHAVNGTAHDDQGEADDVLSRLGRLLSDTDEQPVLSDTAQPDMGYDADWNDDPQPLSANHDTLAPLALTEDLAVSDSDLPADTDIGSNEPAQDEPADTTTAAPLSDTFSDSLAAALADDATDISEPDSAFDATLEATLRAIVDADDHATAKPEAAAFTVAPTVPEPAIDAAPLDTLTLDEPELLTAEMPVADVADDVPEAVMTAPVEDLTETEAEAPLDLIAAAAEPAEIEAASPANDADLPNDDANAPQADTADPGRAHARVIRIRRAESHPAEDAVAATAPLDDPTRPLDKAGEDAAVSRLMRQADDEMAGAENRRRLSAIAHLKAAVAATEAERLVTGEAMSDPTAKADPYREDLAHAVQPLTLTPAELAPEATMPVRPRREVTSRRPEVIRADLPRPGTIRPGIMFPPPLVLVSEQRIDRIAPAGNLPTGPRTGRLTGAIGASAAQNAGVATAHQDHGTSGSYELEDDDSADDDADNIFSDDAGFTDFVGKVGVRSLTDLMEAAAAFATCIEQRQHFSRPYLMRRLKTDMDGQEVSREDALRSFGTLLRSGRIEKVQRGQYALSATSPYLIDARRYAL